MLLSQALAEDVLEDAGGGLAEHQLSEERLAHVMPNLRSITEISAAFFLFCFVILNKRCEARTMLM